jgi:hypothetical protein
MARHRKNKGINFRGLRKKCFTCGSIKLVEHRMVEIPPSTKNYNPKEEKKVHEQKDAIVTHYCSTECAPGGADVWIYNYTELDFWRP